MSTDTTPSEPDDTHLDAWLVHQLSDLTDKASNDLDLDAGLRDAQLADRARSLDTALDAVLDVDSGLGAILADTGQPHQVTTARSDQSSTAPDSVAHYARHVTQLSAHERLTLRSQFPFHELDLIHSLATASVQHTRMANDLNHALGRDHGRDRVRVHRLAVGLARAFDHDLAFVRTRTLVVPRDHVLVRARDRAHDLARALDLAIDLDRTRALDLDHALASARDRAHALASTLDHAVAHAHGLGRVMSGPVLPFERALSLDLARCRTHGGFEELASAIKELMLAVTDFTAADLTALDLRDVDLRGVRWSALTTCWPLGWQKSIHDVSVQIDPDRRPDLYEVRDDPRVPHDVQRT
jgi:hypothetical protein